MARTTRARRVKYDWVGGDVGATALTTTQLILLIFSNSVETTLVRSRGSFFVQAIANAALDADVAGLGLIVVSDEAAAIGGTSVPGPIAKPDASWIWHRYVGMRAAAASAADDSAIGLNVHVQMDSKAMRKVDANSSIILVAELSTGSFGSVRINGGMRTLTTLN